MTKDEYVTFAIFILDHCHCPGLQHGTRQSERSFLNMIIADFVTLTNLGAVYLLNESADKCAIAQS